MGIAVVWISLILFSCFWWFYICIRSHLVFMSTKVVLHTQVIQFQMKAVTNFILRVL